MYRSDSGLGIGVGATVALAEAAASDEPGLDGAAAAVLGEGLCPPPAHAAMIGASAGAAPSTAMRSSSWRRVIRCSTRYSASACSNGIGPLACSRVISLLLGRRPVAEDQ